MKDIKRVQSIDRAVSILECFNEDKRELRLQEISDKLGLNKSTVHGIITTLKYHGFISQNEETQKYKLGIRFIEFGDVVLNSINIRSVAFPVVEEVCSKIDETVQVAMQDGANVVWILKSESTKSVKTSTKIGAMLPIHTTADGKVILCHQESDNIIKYLPKKLSKFTKNTISKKGELLKRLEEIRNNGYAIDNEEYVEGVKCIAAPIFDYDGSVKFSISSTGPAFRMTDEKIKENLIIIKEAAKEISRRLGYKL